jgi:hypothetical protein
VPIGSTEFSTVTAKAVDELAGLVERIDRRVALLIGVDDLEASSSANLDRIRGYCAELRAQAAWDATAHLRLEAEQAAARNAEAEMWQDRRQNAEALVRAGLRPR